MAYGQTGRVQKQRTLFLVGRTRVHLDDVRGLGHFLELEVVLQESESTEAGVVEANDLLARLQIEPTALIDRAYVDLLNRTVAKDAAASQEDIRTCMRVLRAIASDRAELTRLMPEERREMLTLVGLVAKPDRHDVTRMLKAYRRAKREGHPGA